MPAPPAPPLSHHEVLELAGPFARRGFETDLAASRRDERRLVFRPRAAAAGGPTETWQLEDAGPGRWRVVRTLRREDGIEATLQAQGSDIAALLGPMQAVPTERHFGSGRGHVVARHYTLQGAQPVFTHGTAQVAGLTLTLQVPPVRRVAGNLVLTPAPGTRPALPEDLLAVLGWNWARLVRNREGWTSKLRLRSSGEARTRRAEAALDEAAAHLAQTLAEAPAQYHARRRAARWGVYLRRGIPTFTALGLVAAVLLSARFDFHPSAGMMVLMYHVPTLIVALSFMLQELPRFELPPWPRRLRAARWFEDGPGAITRP